MEPMNIFSLVLILMTGGKFVFGNNECKNQADVLFLLDNSGSIGKDTFDLVTEFVKNFPGTDLPIGKYNFQIGVWSYHLIVHQDVPLNQASDMESFREAVGEITYHGGSTSTDVAIKQMYNSSFLEEKGGRPGTSKICILVTDGDYKNTDETRNAAEDARELGIEIFAVGVGKKLNANELKQLVGEGNSDRVYTDRLSSQLRKTLISNICEVSRPSPPIGCSSGADIVFVLDSSGSITQPNFDVILSFVKLFVKSFPIGTDEYMFGLQTFADIANLIFNLKEYTELPSILKRIDSIEYTGGGTETALALKMVNEVMFNNGDRPGQPNIVILITDGRASDHDWAITEADKVKTSGIKIIVVGVGSRIDEDEIKEIASEHVVVVEKFDNLQNNIEELTKKVCADTKTEK